MVFRFISSLAIKVQCSELLLYITMKGNAKTSNVLEIHLVYRSAETILPQWARHVVQTLNFIGQNRYLENIFSLSENYFQSHRYQLICRANSSVTKSLGTRSPTKCPIHSEYLRSNPHSSQFPVAFYGLLCMEIASPLGVKYARPFQRGHFPLSDK